MMNVSVQPIVPLIWKSKWNDNLKIFVDSERIGQKCSVGMNFDIGNNYIIFMAY